MIRTYTIELRVDFDDDTKYDLVLETSRRAAREMLTTSLMLKDKRDPSIMFSVGDLFETNKDLEIMSPDEVEGLQEAS